MGCVKNLGESAAALTEVDAIEANISEAIFKLEFFKQEKSYLFRYNIKCF